MDSLYGDCEVLSLPCGVDLIMIGPYDRDCQVSSPLCGFDPIPSPSCVVNPIMRRPLLSRV